MLKKFFIILYLIVLIADLISVYTHNESLRYITKPLLMPLLVGYFVLSMQPFASPLKKWIILALVFSLLGDVLLMFESNDSNFFILGLIAFLLAHIFYIIFYENVIRAEHIKKKYWWFFPVLIYYSVLIYVLSPHLGEMKLSVRIYGVVISYMLIQALQTSSISNRNAALLMIVGAILFITSDSILAINNFYRSFEWAGIAIMVTYGIAQLLITRGAVLYISSVSKR